MTYWPTDALQGGDVERSYSSWEAHQRGFHDWIELGERVAAALDAENDGAAPETTHAVA